MCTRSVVTVVWCLAATLAASRPAGAHCDSLDGPVVKDARAALEARDAAPVLKWIRADDEGEVRATLAQALAVRVLGRDAELLADRFFFETVVRVHRQGEGEPYTGLKPAGAGRDPAIAAADHALETGSVDALVRLVVQHVDGGLRSRFARALAARRQAERSTELGREYVAAYVELVHYAERLLRDAQTAAVPHPDPHAGGHQSPGH